MSRRKYEPVRRRPYFSLDTPRWRRHGEAQPALRIVSALRPITNERTVLPVTGHAIDAAGRTWLRVRLPGRPNGGVGWIERAGTRTRSTDVRLVIDISLRQVSVYQRAHLLRRFRAVVGRPSTPTPQGEFFVEEAVALPSSAAGAPYALALSARSEVFQEFEGGPGQVAIHGRDHIGGTLGTAVSHGCVRLDTRSDAMARDDRRPRRARHDPRASAAHRRRASASLVCASLSPSEPCRCAARAGEPRVR